MMARSFGEITQNRFRRTHQPVRRNSYDVEDKRSQIFKPIAGGDLGAALSWIDKAVTTMFEWDCHEKQKGERHPLGAGPIRLYELMLRRFTHYATGRCEPCIDTLMRASGWARATIVRYLAALRRHGFLRWQRRTEKTGNPPGEGQQVRQISNAYVFTVEAWPKNALRGLKARLKRSKERLAKARETASAVVRAAVEGEIETSGLEAWTRATGNGDAELVDQLANIAANLDRNPASSESSLNPPSRTKYKRSESG